MNSIIHNNVELNFFEMDFDPCKKKITELSRQLKTYLNYKESTILAVCRGAKKSLNSNKSGFIQKYELELYESNLEYTSFLKNNIGRKDNIKIKVLLFAKKAFSFPNNPEAKSFNKFLKSKIRLWELLHILSGMFFIIIKT